jgi:hypothetical protein
MGENEAVTILTAQTPSSKIRDNLTPPPNAEHPYFAILHSKDNYDASLKGSVRRPAEDRLSGFRGGETCRGSAALQDRPHISLGDLRRGLIRDPGLDLS